MPRGPVLIAMAVVLLLGSQATASDAGLPPWIGNGPDGRQVHLYFFWSRSCPHCQAALPFVQDLEVRHPWLLLHSLEITGEPANAERYARMAHALGETARVVPGFFICGQLLTGFDTPDGQGETILQLARDCRTNGVATSGPMTAQPLPLLGTLQPGELSLPLLTLVLGGLDAFNPCAFFVLLFLLSLLVHTRSHGRMLLVGGVFVLFSGLVYFLFMAAWLNLFLLVSGAPWITALAGIVALVIGALSTRDFFRFGSGPSLSMSADAKGRLFQRMRALLANDRLSLLLVGTVLLALAANSYELLCTAGFPMVYTRTLTLADLPTSSYYGYLLLYNLVYITPLLLIVIAFSATLGRHKLSVAQGRRLKLLSGLMMLGLGTLLLLAPHMLNHALTGVALLAASLLLTWLAGRHDNAGGSATG